jgi:NAD-dependent DNA ligase
MNKNELEKVIKEANMAYSAGIPFITDQEYDILWQALYAIDPDNSLLYHTAQAHNQVHGKSWHKYQIFGTNKAFNMEDLKPFLTRFGDQLLTIEPKYDGCAAVITQEQSG